MNLKIYHIVIYTISIITITIIIYKFNDASTKKKIPLRIVKVIEKKPILPHPTEIDSVTYSISKSSINPIEWKTKVCSPKPTNNKILFNY